MNYDLLLHEIAPYLEKFHKKKIGLYTFRCPLCGDSQKSKLKTRGHIYKQDNKYYFKCFNCGIATTFTNFVKQQFPSIYSRYYFETFKTQDTYYYNNRKEDKESDLYTLDQFSSLKHYLTSPEAIAYVKERRLPENKLSSLYFCEDVNLLIDQLPDTTYKKLAYKSPRIVFPLFNKENNLVGFICRAINKTDSARYYNIKLNEENSLVYGQNIINSNKRVYIVEGIMDSLFLDNALAACSSGFSSAINFCKKYSINYVLLFDNEKHNKQILNLMNNHINNNDPIVLFNDWAYRGKDINEMFLNNRALTIELLHRELEKHIYTSKLRAKLEFNKWINE